MELRNGTISETMHMIIRYPPLSQIPKNNLIHENTNVVPKYQKFD